MNKTQPLNTLLGHYWNCASLNFAEAVKNSSDYFLFISGHNNSGNINTAPLLLLISKNVKFDFQRTYICCKRTNSSDTSCVLKCEVVWCCENARKQAISSKQARIYYNWNTKLFDL